MALTETLTDVEMRFLTYTDLPNHRTNAGRTYLDPQWLKRHCPLDNNSSRLVPASTNASSSQLGSLKLLPLEVIHLILIEVDLQTLTDFRAINWCARSIVDSLAPYATLVQHTPQVLRALLSVRLAKDTPVQRIYEALCSQSCSLCNEIGPYLDLFTGQRCCTECAYRSEEMLTIEAFKVENKLSQAVGAVKAADILRTLPTSAGLSTVPRNYEYFGLHASCRSSLIRLRPIVGDGQTRGDIIIRSMIASNLQAITGLPTLLSEVINANTEAIGHFPADLGFLPMDASLRGCRFMPLIRIPFLDARTGTTDWGVSCHACRHIAKYVLKPASGQEDCLPVYRTADYLTHFWKCTLSRLMRGKMAEADVTETAFSGFPIRKVEELLEGLGFVEYAEDNWLYYE